MRVCKSASLLSPLGCEGAGSPETPGVGSVLICGPPTVEKESAEACWKSANSSSLSTESETDNLRYTHL